MKKGIMVFLALTLIVSAVMTGCAPLEKPAMMVISGKVTLFAKQTTTGTAEPASNVKVALYTYKAPPLPWSAPIGDEITSTVTDEKGNYKLEVLVGKYEKVIVYVDASPQGWKEIEVVKGEKTVDLTKGFPAPLAPPK